MITSKGEICNMALAILGNKTNSVNDIDTPSTDIERAFSVFYDNSRQSLLKMTMPNFALTRNKSALLTTTQSFGYKYSYQYPKDCLKLLGVGNVQDKENFYSIEDGSINCDDLYEDGLPIRYIKDYTDVSTFTPDFKSLLAWTLANDVALIVTQSESKAQYIASLMPIKMATLGSLNAQENVPIRKSISKFKASKFTDYPNTAVKK